MNILNKLEVFYGDRKVGTLATLPNSNFLTVFEYDSEWITTGFAISPMTLPLVKKPFFAKPDPFDGIFGVFADTLPDGWGRLLVDRMLLSKNIDPRTINSLNRLAIVGNTGMGALSYKPVHSLVPECIIEDYDTLALECKKILNTQYSENLDNLFYLGGSSGGARPKILTQYNNQEWIIKFPSSLDSNDIGEEEYLYSLCAKECGIEVPEVKLFPSKVCKGYFGIKRFDRVNEKRVHMLSVSALLETSHRIPNLDYNILMKLTLSLTKSFDEVLKMFKLMCFNVFSHNRDDHSKNFTFLYLEDEKRWVLSPAYDLTYSFSIGGEHATTVNGNGKNPSLVDILAVAENIGIKKDEALNIATEIKGIVEKNLSYFLKKKR